MTTATMTFRVGVMTVLWLLATGCGGGAGAASAPSTDTSLPLVTHDAPAQGAPGTTIDPSKKTVVMVEAPVEDPAVEQHMAELQEESAATVQQVRDHIDTYSQDIGGGRTAEVPPGMSDALDTYKSQALDTFKTKQQLSAQASQSSAGNAP